MDSLTNPVNILVLTSHEDEADRIVTSLRNGGLAVHGTFLDQPERLRELTGTQPLDLIVCCDYDPAIDLAACMRHYSELGRDLPLIVIADEQADAASLIAAMRAGARDLTEHRDTQRLQLVVARELADLDHRRMEGRLRERLRDCERQARALIDAPRSNLDGEPGVRVMVREQTPQVSPAGPSLLDVETGLPNRAALMAELATRLDRGNPNRTPFAVLYVGIRRLPAILQTAGLTAGLAAAAAFAASLRGLAPAGAFLARFGDDAVVLLIEDIGQAGAKRLAAHIAHAAHPPPGPGVAGAEAPIFGIGLTLADPTADSAPAVLDTAYRDYLFGPSQRDQGPSSTGISTASADSGQLGDGEDALQLASRIDDALEGEGFELVYQPIVSLKGDSQENYSVLLHLRDHDRSLREAKEFFAAAMRSGRMVAIDRWVIRHAVTEVAAKHARGEKINFFVTIAEETLREEDLLFWICDCLRKSRARGNWLTIQAHAEHARRHASAFAKLSEGLRKVKCRVALNRFGTGADPEILLRDLPADFVRFAPELVQGLADDAGKQRRLLELARLARDAGSRSIVTGVEDARTLTVVWTAGIDYVQGKFLQRPNTTIESQRGGTGAAPDTGMHGPGKGS